MRNIMWAEYGIYKDGKDTERTIGFFYHKFKNEERERKLKELLEEYPESEGYKLMYISDYPDDDFDEYANR